MKVRYVCENCGETIAELRLARLDERRLGFNNLTPEERNDLVQRDLFTGDVTVQSLCDDCVEAWNQDRGTSGPAIH